MFYPEKTSIFYAFGNKNSLINKSLKIKRLCVEHD